ncbi:hypothetical protein LTR66_012148, partial [Elasticomyces elasticus]
MALTRKYATLPDLDNAPDIYETPDLIDDTSTFQTSTTARSSSPASSASVSASDDDDEKTSGIYRRRIHPDQARDRFLTSRVDARNVDFSDRLSGRRSSYKVSSRRRRRDGRIVEDDQTSEEGEEGLERRLARLTREIEEVKADMQKNKTDGDTGDGDARDEDGGDVEDEVDSLSAMLEQMRPGRQSAATSLQSRLTRPQTRDRRDNTNGTLQADTQERDTLDNDNEPAHTLSAVVAFDDRLTLLEKALGITALDLPSSSNAHVKAILPTLDLLDHQITTIASSSIPSLEAAAAQLRQLKQDSEQLDRARSAQQQQQQQSSQTADAQSRLPLDPDSMTKLDALHSTLNTITSLSPTLPPLLDRL